MGELASKEKEEKSGFDDPHNQEPIEGQVPSKIERSKQSNAFDAALDAVGKIEKPVRH